MNRIMRAAAAAAVLAGGLGSVGCVHTGGAGGGATVGDRWRNAHDPCYPERYNHAARQAVVAPFAQQVHNGHVMNQTIWNWYWEPGTDKLTLAGMEKLDSLARTRPAPDPKIYIQTSRDLVATPDTADKVAMLRDDLNVRRAAAIHRYMAAQPTLIPVTYEVFVHDPIVPSIYSEFAASSWRGSLTGYRGGVSGAGTGVLGTGGGAAPLTAPPPAASGGPR
jgi:hypothetical protein